MAPFTKFRGNSWLDWLKRFFHRTHVSRQHDLTSLFDRFKSVLAANNRSLEAITDLGEKFSGEYLFDVNYTKAAYGELYLAITEALKNFKVLTGNGYPGLEEIFDRIDRQVQRVITETDSGSEPLIMFYPEITWEMSEAVGGKNYHLALLSNDLHLKIPKAFAFTTRAFDLFMAHNQLTGHLESLGASSDAENELKNLRQAVLAGAMPEELEDEIAWAVRKMAGYYRKKYFVAVRSSAEEEDEDFTFAGQFESELSVPATTESICIAWQQVVASLFTERAAAYQQQLGFGLGRLKMAAACVAMVAAKVSGVIYTIAGPGREDTLLINGSWGLGPAVVDGITDADLYLVHKNDKPVISETRLGNKEVMVVGNESGGIKTIPTPMELRGIACLSEKQILELAGKALSIEKYFRKPQDIEWAIDERGEIFILQSRALKTYKEEKSSESGGPAAETLDLPVILKDQGIVVRPGITAGRVFVIRNNDDLSQVPRGAVLVAHHDSAQYVKVIPYINAIITDTGVATSHMASICREFEIPTVVNTGNATELLPAGREVTVMAGGNDEVTVFDGVAHDLLHSERQNIRTLHQIYEFRRQKYLMRYIAPLHLVNPLEEDFVPEKCRSVHDMIRFMHEKAVQALVNGALEQARGLSGRKKSIRELELPLPIRMLLIDIGGALAEGSGPKANLEQIRSKPLNAILQGMLQLGVWRDEAMPLKGVDLLAGMTRAAAPGTLSAAAGANLAVASAEYVNLSLRFGYHFNMLDCYCTDQPRNNHIFFRFVGGAAAITSRSLRIHFMSRVLETYGFLTRTKGDLLVARIAGLPREEIEGLLTNIGRLIGSARQMDAAMVSIEAAESLAADFLAGRLPEI